MANCLITLHSVTYSLKAQRLLSEQGIAAQTVKLGSPYAQRGCTHGIRLDCRSRREAEKLLVRNGIPYSAVTET